MLSCGLLDTCAQTSLVTIKLTDRLNLQILLNSDAVSEIDGIETYNDDGKVKIAV